jgi:glutathione-regulated potassium-efflux system ancillary protein KefG
MRNLVIVAHPTVEQSRVNKAMLSGVQAAGIMAYNLYEKYPDEQIDVGEEQRLMVEADRIVLQFPFYWYSSPALLKKWIDAVMTYGWAYGQNGDALAGKELLIAISTGGPAEAYRPEGYNRYAIEDLLLPYHAMANLTRLRFATPFVISGVRMLSDEQLDAEIQRYVKRLTGE